MGSLDWFGGRLGAGRRTARCGWLGSFLAVATGSHALAGEPVWQFTDVTDQIGATYQYRPEMNRPDTRDFMSGGLAAADIDGDGLVDLYIPQGNTLPGLLLRNQGDGTFANVAEEWGIEVSRGPNASSYATGAAFADLTGNGFPDLVLPGVRAFGLRLYLNNGETFTEATASWGLQLELQEQYSVAFADVNRDGRLDLSAAHWKDFALAAGGHLWLNHGDHLSDVSEDWGLNAVFDGEIFTFTPNFSDLNGDGWPDLAITGDFETSQYFHNERGSSYRLMTDEVISDENGMGGALGDFDNDGDTDWFVTSIYHEDPDLPFGGSGNRMYRNDGTGRFTDFTDRAGVRQGGWGWGACMADFNHSGYLDIFMVNGWNGLAHPFPAAPARMFVNQGDGSFVERAEELGVADRGEGRGIVCFDYDRDGDIDIFIQNNHGEGSVYRNNASELSGNWLGIRLAGDAPNTAGIGAQVTVVAGQLEQVREMRIPNHYLSTSPPELLFGLGKGVKVEQVTVKWPDGQIRNYGPVAPNQWVEFSQAIEDEIFGDVFEGEP